MGMLPPLAAQTSSNGVLNSVVLQKAAEGLSRPTSVTNAGDGSGRLFVTEQAGVIRVVAHGEIRESPLLDIHERVTCCGERGLLGLAFHPDFIANGFFYVFYSDADGTSVLSRFRLLAGDDQADPASELVLLRIEQFATQHKGGQLAFGPDGLLYVGVGDGEGSGPNNPRAQQLGNLYGSVLRIDVDSPASDGTSYSIPADNPFVAQEGARGEIWSYGLRNPWRFSFDQVTGDLFLADVGEASVEEINIERAGDAGGHNYGWNILEGTECLDGSADCAPLGGFTPPALSFSHEFGCAAIGGYVYRGHALPSLEGKYLYGDFCSGVLWAAEERDGEWVTGDHRSTGVTITTFGEDEDGEIYLAHLGGDLYRLGAPDVPPSISFVYPGKVLQGGPEFPLYIIGANFVTGVEVAWNGEPRPVRVLDNGRMEVTVDSSDLASAGPASLTVTNPALPGSEAATAEVQVEPAGDLAPAIDLGGIVSAAGFQQIPLVPGSIATLFGSDVAAETTSVPATPLPTNLGGSGVRFDGRYWAPFFYASAGQLNFQVPWELSAPGQASVEIVLGDKASEAAQVELAEHAPSVFEIDQIRPRQGAVILAETDNLFAAPEAADPPARPLRAGETVTIYLNGMGAVTHPPANGRRAGAFPLSETVIAPEVTIGGVPLEIRFSGLTPGSISLYQINAVAPAGLPSGDAVDLVVTIGGVSSRPVVIAVE